AHVIGRERTRFFSRMFIAASTTALLSTAACRKENAKQPRREAATAPADRIARDTAGGEVRDTVEVAGGGVDDTSARTTEKWIFDPNVLSLLTLMNQRQISADEVELENWHSDTVRAFASQVAHDHAVLQRSIDSLVERINMMPVLPAVAVPIG